MVKVGCLPKLAFATATKTNGNNHKDDTKTLRVRIFHLLPEPTKMLSAWHGRALRALMCIYACNMLFR